MTDSILHVMKITDMDSEMIIFKLRGEDEHCSEVVEVYVVIKNV